MTIETKFAPGDEVWMMENNRACSFAISEVRVACSMNYLEGFAGMPEISYKIKGRGDPWYSDTSFFATKAELLASL